MASSGNWAWVVAQPVKAGSGVSGLKKKTQVSGSSITHILQKETQRIHVVPTTASALASKNFTIC